MMLPASQLWLIPALPLVAAVVGAAAPRTARRLPVVLALVAILGSFLLSSAALFGALAAPAAKLTANFTWFLAGSTPVRLGWLLDPLGALMSVLVCAVSVLVFVFSTAYLREDPRIGRFFTCLSLFVAAMLGLLVANSLLLLLVCWELVGLASYLLIGFWFERPAAAAAAKKAFVTTRLGDLGFLLGLLWLFHATGSSLFYDGGAGVLEAGALERLAATVLPGGWTAATGIGLLLFAGAVGKSGQFPLHVWLPDAMEGPTPVSALIHAATMVAAGVFLVARVFPLMAADQGLAAVPVHALTAVAVVGSITALLGAALAVAQTDIKRVLAYSTVSQLGYMMLAVGVGAWVAAVFHLITHACFKALLFLGSGSVIHAAHHEQDSRRLGGLAGRMRFTYVTFLLGTGALIGLPLVFSGFWSKEAVLHAAELWPVSQLPFFAGLAGVVLTAFYMTRLVCETFLGRARGEGAEHAQESPRAMTLPLAVLAVASISAGWIGTPAWPWLQSQLTGAPVVAHGWSDGLGLMVLSTVLVGVGIAAGWWMYGRRPRVDARALDPLAQRWPRVFAALAARLWFDEWYAATFGRLLRGAAALAAWLERWVWGGVVGLTGRIAETTGEVNRAIDEDGLNTGFDRASDGLRHSAQRYSRGQTGDVQGYLRAVVVGLAVLALLLIWGGVR